MDQKTLYQIRGELKELHQIELQDEHLLGKGGFGVVYRAQTLQGVPRAIKISHSPIDSTSDAVAKELRTLRDFKDIGHHPQICTLISFHQIRGHLVTCWELGGDSLADRLKESQKAGSIGIPLGDLLHYMADVAKGIDFLHQRGFVHRDIKPENLVLFQGCVKLTDFGLSKFVGASSCLATVVGTRGFMPPEVIMGGHLNHTSDLYALAATYIRLRTGKLPFGDDWEQIFPRQLAGSPALEGLHKDEAKLVRQALAPDPSRRPQDGAEAWVARLKAATSSIPPAPPPAPMPRPKSRLRRRFAAFLACALALLFLYSNILFLYSNTLGRKPRKPKVFLPPSTGTKDPEKDKTGEEQAKSETTPIVSSESNIKEGTRALQLAIENAANKKAEEEAEKETVQKPDVSPETMRETGAGRPSLAFKVHYVFTVGHPESSEPYFWVVTRAHGDPARHQCQLAEGGTLTTHLWDWRREDGPFHTYFEDRHGQRISDSIPLPISRILYNDSNSRRVGPDASREATAHAAAIASAEKYYRERAAKKKKSENTKTPSTGP